MPTLRIVSVNISEKKGTIKLPVDYITLNQQGVEGDAHSGLWHRQVSLLGKESFEKMKHSLQRELMSGEFAENITTEGYELYKMKPLDRLISGNVVLEVTQIGKKCHGSSCAIFKESGDCVMPREGIFCRVIKGGKLKPGDELHYEPKILKIKIITVSDRASRGEYEDISGPHLKKILEHYFNENGRKTDIENNIVPDEPEILENLIKQHIETGSDLVFTTGGTGIGRRDITPETVKSLLEKEIPGIMEHIRVKYGAQYPNALISRGIAGISGNTLIYTLPGNPKAVEEYAAEILKTLEHSFRMIYQIDYH